MSGAPGRNRFGLDRLLEPAFIRYLMVGLLNTAFGYGMFYLLLLVGLPPEIALFCATALGVLFNFMTASRLVFRERGWRFLLPFVGVYLLVYLLNAGLLRLLISAGFSAAVAQGLLFAPFVLVTYVLLKRLVYTRKSGQSD